MQGYYRSHCLVVTYIMTSFIDVDALLYNYLAMVRFLSPIYELPIFLIHLWQQQSVKYTSQEHATVMSLSDSSSIAISEAALPWSECWVDDIMALIAHIISYHRINTCFKRCVLSSSITWRGHIASTSQRSQMMYLIDREYCSKESHMAPQCVFSLTRCLLEVRLVINFVNVI